VWRFLKDRATVAVIALWSLAVVQPLLDLFGRSPEFFVVNEISRLEMVVLAVVIVLLGPVVLLTVQFTVRRFAPAYARPVHLTTVGLLCALLALSIQRQLEVDDAVIAGAVAVLAGVLGAYVEDNVAVVRTGLRYLAWSPLLFLAAFLVTSQSADLLLHPGDVDVAGGTAGDPAPIVMVSLDEFPLASLLRDDGTINAERFPNFARLAESSTWYRDATSMAQTTELSVPATLTGELPDPDALPTARDHPRSLFTLFQDQYDEWVREQVTNVCPTSICPSTAGAFDLDRLWSAATDSAAVYSHLVVPESLADHLPVIDRSWGGFVTEDADASEPSQGRVFESLVDAAAHEDAEGEPRGVGGPDPSCPDAAFWCAPARIAEMAEDIADAGTDQPHLWMVHATTPHLPWLLTPAGEEYLPRSLDAFVVDGLEQDNAWSDDEVAIRQAFQRHLLQVGAVDRMLGQVIDALEDADLWDDALVVVVADHGVAFAPNQPNRQPRAPTMAEIFDVPLFIKAPHQARGEVDEGNARTIDVLPTIIDLLDVDTDWELDGTSLASGDRADDKPALVDGEPTTLSTDFDDVLAVVDRNRSYLPYGQDWIGAAAVGDYGDLVGRPLDELGPTDPALGTWRTDQADALADWDPGSGELSPVFLHGVASTGLTFTPTEGLVVLNGRVAGVAVDFQGAASEVRFTAILAEELLQPGRNDIQLLLPSTIGGTRFHVVPYVG
jgi:hypothetical protein